jgi:hypothetical protein
MLTTQAKNHSKHRLLGTVILLCMQSLIGCAAQPEPDPIVAEQPQELNEFSCTSSGVSLAQPNGAAVNMQYPNCSIVDSAATSNDGTYDQSLCPNQFVTEVRQANNHPFTAFVEAVAASTITSQSVCNGILVNGAAWGFNGTSWVTLGTVQSAGVWHPASCGPLFCFPASCQLRFNIASGSGYSKVRIAGFAAALAIFKGRVTTGVRAGPGPC